MRKAGFSELKKDEPSTLVFSLSLLLTSPFLFFSFLFGFLNRVHTSNQSCGDGNLLFL